MKDWFFPKPTRQRLTASPLHEAISYISLGVVRWVCPLWTSRKKGNGLLMTASRQPVSTTNSPPGASNPELQQPWTHLPHGVKPDRKEEHSHAGCATHSLTCRVYNTLTHMQGVQHTCITPDSSWHVSIPQILIWAILEQSPSQTRGEIGVTRILHTVDAHGVPPGASHT